MALTQFTSDWNNAFELKISVADIKRPTQSFLFGVLDLFLGTINIDCDKMKSKMGERKFKIWVVRYYSDFFKTCNPKCYPLYYGDLLKPESKKVLEILRFLLNFHMFHQAARTEIVNTANEKIELYNQWLSKKNQLQLQQEEAKIQSELKEEILKETTREIAECKQQLEELAAKNARLTKETDEVKLQMYRIRVENIDLSSQIDGMQPSIVTEHELASISKSILDVENNISDLNAIQEDIQYKNQCFSQEMSELSAKIDELLSANVNEVSVAESIEKIRDEMKNLADLNNKAKGLRHQFDNTVGRREELQESIRFVEAQLVSKRNDLGSLLQDRQTKVMNMESACKRGSTEAADLAKKFVMLEQKVERLKETQDELITMGIQVIDYIKNS